MYPGPDGSARFEVIWYSPGMALTPAEYEARIAALRRELDALRAVPMLTGTMAVGVRTSSLTVAGAEEMILEVRHDDAIGYVNRPMATLLGVSDRKAVIGRPLADFDKDPLGAGVLAGIAQVARRSEDTQILERACPGLPWERLPPSDGERPASAPLLRFVATGTGTSVSITAQDVTRLRWLEQTFSRYVPPAVIEQMSQMPADQFLRTERRVLTVLFADLRGFTAMSQHLPPEQVQEVVNSFLGNMVDCIERLEGTVDKFVGDEVMAIFGAPVQQPDHALRALICGIEMQREHSRWMRERDEAGLPHAGMGVGLATGPVVVGNIGTDTRVDYTALGHTVNLAARLCGSAAAGEVLTVRETHGAALGAVASYGGSVAMPRLEFGSRGHMRFKNVADPIEVIAALPG